MKKITKKFTQSFQKFWRFGYKIKGKNFSIGAFVSAILILGIGLLAIHYLGFLAILILWIKQGVRVVFAMVAKLTFKALLIMGLKRAVIDYIISPQLQKRVLRHILPAMMSRLKHTGGRFGRWLAYILGGFATVIMAAATFFTKGFLLIKTIGGILLAKVATIFGFKSLWVLTGHAWFWIQTTPFGLLIQVYVYGWLVDRLIKFIPEPIRAIFRPVRQWLYIRFLRFERFLDKLFGWHLEEWMKRLARRMEPVEARKNRIRNHLTQAKQERENKEKQKEQQRKEIQNQINERFILALERKKQKKQRGWQHPDARITGFRSSDTQSLLRLKKPKT